MRAAGRAELMRAARQEALVPLLIIHQLRDAIVISREAVPSERDASGNECLEVPECCQRLAPPRRLQNKATP